METEDDEIPRYNAPVRSFASIVIALGLGAGLLGAACATSSAAAPASSPPKPPAPAPATAAQPTTPPTTKRAAPPRQVATVEGITEYALDNGLHVLLFPDATKETFTLNVTYRVGSRMEGYGETGMAHLLEHMLFKGSPKHPKVWEELQGRGAANNATTWYDRTNYFETLPAKGDNLAWAIEMEADRMVNADIAASELAKEFSVVRNEFEIGENNPDRILSERIWSTAFLWHNYGKSTIGSRADIEKVPATALRAFYKKYYRPDNAVVVLTGKFDPKVALGEIAEQFGTVTNPPTPLAVTYTVEPVQDGERNVTLRRNGDVQIAGLAFHIPAASDPDHVKIGALSQILTDEPAGRLYTGLVKTGLATSVASSVLTLHDPGLLELAATVPVGKSLDQARDKLISIVEGLAATKITDEEIARYKAKAKKRFKALLSNSQRLGTALTEYIGAGDWRLLFLTRDRVAQLTAEDVRKAAASYLVSSNRTLGLFLPTKTPTRAPHVEAPDVAAMVAGYKGAPPEAEGEKFDASLENIEKRTERSTLASGMKLAVLAKQTRSHMVRARLTLHYGTEADFTGKPAAISMLDAMLARGTRQHTYQQLQDQWDLLEAQVNFASQPGQLDVMMQTTRDNLGAVLALIDEVLRQSTFPQDQFELVIKEAQTALEAEKSDPSSQAFTALNRATQPYPATHPRYTPTTEEQLAQLKALRVGDIKNLAAMFGASNATMAIVGDVDVPATKAWLTKTWGTWRSPRPWKRVDRKYTPPSAGEQVLDFADKANAMIIVGHMIALKEDDVDAVPLTVANYVLGSGFTSRLLSRLRQKDGLSYGAGSSLQLPPLEAAGAFFALAQLNPENAKKGMAAMLEEIGKLVATGVTAAELAVAKQAILQSFQRNLSNDDFVTATLNNDLYLGRTTDFWMKRNAAIGAVTVEQINAALQRYLKPDALVKVTAGDKQKM